MKFLVIILSIGILSGKSSAWKISYPPCGQNGYQKACGLDFGQSSCDNANGGGDMSSGNCVPMVVRPHDIPKPAVAATAALSLAPVPGPCLQKKVIVKPAVLPKPVCSATGQASYTDSCHSSHNYGYQQDEMSIDLPSDCRPIGVPGFPGYPGYPVGPNCAENQANCAPADAVSLSLAYNMAKERNYRGEDKLAFGFRKLPIELPRENKDILFKQSFPEENIFALNGQVVELKPVTQYGPQKTLEEEAAEDLLALENEEIEESNYGQPVRTVSLGELGYSPAKLTSPSFVDVTAATSAVGEALERSSGYKSSCSCGGTPSCKIIPGDVVYKTVPAPQQICLPPVPVPDSCESSEIEFEQEQPENASCTCSCVPVVMKKCHQHSHHQCHKKTSVTIQKLLA